MTTNASAPVGVLIIDKPAGMTSHDVVDHVRRVTGVRRVGHAGTLDPFATGMLIVGVGREATKRLGGALRWPKEYEAIVHLGATSTTDDPEGTIFNDQFSIFREIPKVQIINTLRRFTGEIDQIPPVYAAIKKDGKKLYEYARAGQTVEREPRRVTIHELELMDYAWPKLQIRVRCSSGTYIRALARDIGAALGVGGYLTSLRRTVIGPFQATQAVALDRLTANSWTDYLLAATALDEAA